MVEICYKTNMQGKLEIKFLLTGIFLFLGIISWSQEDIHIYGAVKEMETNHKLESVLVQVTQDGKTFDSYTTSGSSKFEFDLPLGHLYEINFSKSDYVGKKIQINTKYIPEEDQEGGFKLDLDMSLFAYIEGFNEAILDEPIGIAAYDAERNSIEFDFDYTRQIMNKVDAENIRLQNLSAAEKEKRNRFDDLMIQGSDDLTKEKYAQAIGNYTAALNLFPDEVEAQEKLEEAQGLLALQNKDVELEAQYQAAIKDGNDLINSRDYEASMTKFLEAKSLKPGEREPKDKIRELEGLIAEAENKKKFDEFMVAGDNAMSSEEYQSAVDNFKLAREIIFDDKEMKKKLAEAQEKLDALLSAEDAEEAQQKRYDDIIAKAGVSFSGEDYDLCISQYNQALEIFPSEEYPVEQIKLAQKRIEELEKEKLKNAEVNAGNELDAEYQNFIDKGNDLFTSKELLAAKEAYESALGVKPNEKYPNQRIKRIDELLADLETEAKEALANADADTKEEERIAELERQKQLKQATAEEEKRKLEEELADKERFLAEERRKKEEVDDARRNLSSNIDTEAERQAEEFYKQEKLDAVKEKNSVTQQQKDAYTAWLKDKGDSAQDIAKDASADIEASKNSIKRMYADNENDHKDKRENFDSGEKDNNRKIQESENIAQDRRINASFELEGVKSDNASDANEKNRQAVLANKEKVDDSKKELIKAENRYEEKGLVLRKDKQYAIDRAKERLGGSDYGGGNLRQEAEKENNEVKADRAKFVKENTYLQDERIMVNSEKIDDQKRAEADKRSKTEDSRKGNEDEVNVVKEDIELFQDSKQGNAALQRRIDREAIFNVNVGQEKEYDDYNSVQGTEDLAEGVTERSFEINQGRKLVIERTVKLGNKIETYSKVIDKNNTYYFKNNKSITKSTWNRETLSLAD